MSLIGLPCAILLAVVATSPASAGEEPSAVELLRGVQEWLDGTRDLQGQFEQSLISSALGADILERGEMFVMRPGRMRWDYHEPETKVAIVDGDRTLFYTEEDAQLTHGRLDADTDLLPGLLTGEARLAEAFRPERVELPDIDGRRLFALRLLPLDEEQGFQEVILVVRAPHYRIEAVEVLDSAGNRVLYRFRALRRNRGLPEALFAFEPPPGTAITGQP